jgi:hypothetical protein
MKYLVLNLFASQFHHAATIGAMTIDSVHRWGGS